jgi:hypothetical protein
MMVSASTPSPYLAPSKVSTYGPILNKIEYSNYADLDTAAAADIVTGTSLQGFDLSFTAAEWTSFPSSVGTGSTSSFGFDGIYFNQLQPIVNTTAFHQAIAFLWNSSLFESTVLEGLAGTAGPQLWPCTLFAKSCDTATLGTAANPNYGTSDNLQAAYTALTSIKSSSGYQYLVPYENSPNIRITSFANLLTDAAASNAVWCVEGVATPIACTSSSTVGFSAGNLFVIVWYWRESLNREYFSDWIILDGSHIGLTFTRPGDGSIDDAIPTVFIGSLLTIVTPATYQASGKTCVETKYQTPSCKGYNTPAVYDYTQVIPGGSDYWSMYSYGYSASVDYVGNDELMNSAYQSADYFANHNVTMDYNTNAVIYAGSSGKAATANKLVAEDQMQTLPFLNIYYENLLYANYITGWTGLAAIPNYGPSSGPGLAYTALNAHLSDYNSTGKNNPAKYPNGGTLIDALGGGITGYGGLNPLYSTPTVYDEDMWVNTYDTVLGTPPTGFTAPLVFNNWMTTKYVVKAYGGTKGLEVPAGSFLFQAPRDSSGLIVKGLEFTFTFMPDIYWTDGVQFTALDYNFSLYQSDLAGSPSLPDSATPDTGGLTGQAGLIASYVPNPLTISIFVNSSSVWALEDIQVPLLPMHIFYNYFSQDEFASTIALDTAFNAQEALTYDNIPKSPYTALTLPAWINSLPNLEVGTGPFILREPTTPSEETSNTGLFVSNPNYYREYWQMYTWNSSNIVHKGSTFTPSFFIYQWSYNTTASGCASAVDNVCQIPMTYGNTGGTISGTWFIAKQTTDVAPATGYTSTGVSGTFSCSGGHCTANLPTSKTGTFHVIIDIIYTYQGLPRTWYQSWGYKVIK